VLHVLLQTGEHIIPSGIGIVCSLE